MCRICLVGTVRERFKILSDKFGIASLVEMQDASNWPSLSCIFKGKTLLLLVSDYVLFYCFADQHYYVLLKKQIQTVLILFKQHFWDESVLEYGLYGSRIGIWQPRFSVAWQLIHYLFHLWTFFPELPLVAKWKVLFQDVVMWTSSHFE